MIVGGEVGDLLPFHHSRTGFVTIPDQHHKNAHCCAAQSFFF